MHVFMYGYIYASIMMSNIPIYAIYTFTHSMDWANNMLDTCISVFLEPSCSHELQYNVRVFWGT